MTQAKNRSPQAKCENILKSERDYNVEHNILPSEVAIIDRLLRRPLELLKVYNELEEKLDRSPSGLRTVLRTLLSTAAFWCPEKSALARHERAKLREVNRKIAASAQKLAELLEERELLNNHSGFFGGEIYDVYSAIEAAGSDQTLFQWHVKEPLQRLSGQYDMKYWPSLPVVIQAIATDADTTKINAGDALTAAGTEGARSSRADFFKSLFVALEKNSQSKFGLIPRDFRLSDESLASLANCALDHGAEELVDGAYVKRLRQRRREIILDERAVE